MVVSRRTAETCIGKHEVADHPCSLGPSLAGLLDAGEMDVPVQVWLQVLRLHAGEPPRVALDPGAEVVRHRDPLEMHRIARVRLVGFVGALDCLDEGIVGALPVPDDGRALRDMRLEALPDPPGGRLAAAARDGDGILVGVDRHGDARLLPGEPALPGLPESVGEVRVHDIRLAGPRPVLQDDPALVAIRGCERPVAPSPCRLVGDAADLGRSVERHVEAHGAHELDPCGHVRLAVLEDRARGGLCLLPQPRHRNLCSPLSSCPSHHAPLAPQDGRAGSGRQGLAASAKVPNPTASRHSLARTADGSRAKPPESSPATACEGIPPRHGGIPSAAWSLPGGVVAKQRAGQAPGRILCLAAQSYHARRAQAHMFVTRLLDC